MKRLWEIDALRGVAIMSMIIFHAVYILVMFKFIFVDMFAGFWWIFARCIAGTFLLLVGISLTLSYNRVKDSLPGKEIIKRFLFRGLIILGMGFIITIVTYVVFGHEAFVLFGVLHLIGTSIIIAIPFISRTYINLITGILILGLGLYLGLYRFDFFWLLWLGFRPGEYYPVDYLPLLPWASYVFLGVFLGNTLYNKGRNRIFPLPEISDFFIIKGLCFLGRYSIFIYLGHIPVIYGIVYGVDRLLYG